MRDRFYTYSENKLQEALLGYTETIINNAKITFNEEDYALIENLDDGQYESLLTQAYFYASTEALNAHRKLVVEFLKDYINKVKK